MAAKSKEKGETAKQGRPTSYSKESADAICECVATGDSLRQAAQKQGVSESTVREWRKANAEFSAQYACAVIERAEVFFERGNDIAMAISNGEQAQVARVQLDWLKWSASKLAPKAYGDKLDLNHSGEVNVSLADRIAKARKRNEA